ncbi:MAG: Alcohol dehydrogenase zinc-binding domain protein [Caulobacteraceae bacterium]|nr:Alcohol dehydrogenase zinc-binding domain protein [Caulobacteraceae bacterium]
MTSREVRLAARPKGDPTPADFQIVAVETPTAGPGQVLLKTRWISVDPMILILIVEKPMGGAFPPLPVGTVIPGAAVSEVVVSNNADFAVGDVVEGRTGWREYAVSDGAGLRKVDPADGPVSSALGILGLPGFSAYAGLQVSGELGPGQTVLVSGAAGAVGTVFGPLAKQTGATLVGIASGPERCRALVAELGYDRAVDRLAADFPDQLAKAAPNGVDLYFDTVGGQLFDRVLPLMNRKGRVTICGLMAQYAEGPAQETASVPLQAIMAKGLIVRAFSNTDYGHLQAPFRAEVGKLLREGVLKANQQVSHGIESVPEAFCRLFTDSIIGKSVVSLEP